MNDSSLNPVGRRLALILAFSMVLGVVGCGVKGPPMPPHQKPAIAVTDLKAAVDRKAIVLTWSGAGESKEIVGYDVYSSRSDLAQPACPGCPMEFVKVGTLAIKGDQASGQPHRFSFSAAPGYRYRVKVRPYLATGNSGPESNTVMIEFHYP